MTPRAYVVHQTRDRLRLRIPEQRNDEEFFEALRAELEALPDGVDVHVKPSTASVLLVHPTMPFAELEPRLRGSRLFTLANEPRPSRRALSPLISAVSAMDRGLAKVTSGSTDLRTLLFIAVVGLAIRQLLRGEVLGPAIPMLLVAVQIADSIAASKPSPENAEAEESGNRA